MARWPASWGSRVSPSGRENAIGERLIQSEADRDPQAQGSALSLAQFDLADPCLIDADKIGQLPLRDVLPLAA